MEQRRQISIIELIELKTDMKALIEDVKKESGNINILSKLNNYVYVILPRAIDLLEIKERDYSELVEKIFSDAVTDYISLQEKHATIISEWRTKQKPAAYAVARRKKYKEAGIDYNKAKDIFLLGLPTVEGITEEVTSSFLKDVEKQITKDQERREKNKTLPAKLEDVLRDCNLPNTFITQSGYEYALTTVVNDVAYMRPYNNDFLQLSFVFDEDAGILLYPEEKKAEVLEEHKKTIDLKKNNFDNVFVRQLFAATLKSILCLKSDSIIKVYLPNFINSMGITVKYEKDNQEEYNSILNKKSNDIFKKINELEGWAGVMKGGRSWYRAFSLISIDDNILTFAAPYFSKLINVMMQDPIVIKNSKGFIKHRFLGISKLVKPTIMKARNKTTVEILIRLLTGLTQKGEENARNNLKNEYKIKFKTIIDDVPILKQSLGADNAFNTKCLKMNFCGYMKDEHREIVGLKKGSSHILITEEDHKKGVPYILEEYLRKYTFVYDYYDGFKIDFQPPSFMNLEECITITYKNKKNNFNYPYELNLNI